MVIHSLRRARQRGLALLAVLCSLTALLSAPAPARAASTTWVVDRAGDDATDGDIASHRGSLRFDLAHAVSGDLVRFGSISVDTLFVSSTLVVPAGVELGGRRADPCPAYNTPFMNIEDGALDALDPIISLGAGATLHGVALGGGRITVRVTGADVDVCGSALGVIYESDGNPTSLQPSALALSVDGARATVRQNYINGAVAVSPRGSDTRIGDAIGGSGDGNAGIRDASVTVVADSHGAAQRVTIRDPFPRGLVGIVGAGVSGGDDDPLHANNWALRPSISSVTTADGQTVQVQGVASPLSLVDLYFDSQVTITTGISVTADSDGAYSYSGPLPADTRWVYVASTLNDAAHPNRVGSSSPWAGPAAVIQVNNPPLLAATARVSDLSGPEGGPAHAGDTLRFTVTMTNVGQVDVSDIRSSVFQTSTNITVAQNSGRVLGQGGGFVATDGGFSGGTLAPGKTATYQLDAIVKAGAVNGAAVFTLEVNGAGIVSIPVVGRMRLAAPAPALEPRAWLAFIMR